MYRTAAAAGLDQVAPDCCPATIGWSFLPGRVRDDILKATSLGHASYRSSIQYSIQFHEYLIGGSCLLYFLRSFPSSFSTGFKENVVRIRNITKRHKILRVIINRVIETGTYNIYFLIGFSLGIFLINGQALESFSIEVR